MPQFLLASLHQTSTMADDDSSDSSSSDLTQGVKDLISANRMQEIGLNLLRFEGKKVSKSNKKTNDERFIANYGSSPLVCSMIYEDLQRTRVPAARVSSKANLKVRFFLMAIHFLKCYPTERQREATFQYCPSWSRRKIWFWINQIAALQSEKIFWPKDNFGNDIWAITVDGAHCWIQEPTHQEFSKDTSYFSHKYNHAGLCYELGISIGSNRLVWMNGPFPAGKSDLKIFKEDGLKAMLIAKKKMCIADGGYAGSDHIHHCSTPNIHDSRPVRRFKARALKRHEKFNGLIKNFHSVDCRFRHSIGKFKSVFEAICVICQYQIETDKPLYHALVEDVLLEDEVE
ncbi:hypothetical protein IV203_030976 [Nitzschia inconspicua]|nr:hypothetical protein IV203_030976 [Nitzschia inconspicua]